jgi:DNA-binding NarL/FixJ family response regulator
VNDYEIIIAGLSQMLGKFPDRVALVDRYLMSDAGERVPVDVTLFDTFGRSSLGFSQLRDLIDDSCAGAVVLFTTDDDPARVRDALDLGVRGYISKATSAQQLVEDLETIADGGCVVRADAHRPVEQRWPGDEWGLTVREAEVLALLISGMRNRQIADALFVSLDTVKTHLRHIYRKLGTTSRSHTVAKALSLSGSAFFRRENGHDDLLPSRAEARS